MAEYYSGMNLYMDILEWVVVIAGGYFTYIERLLWVILLLIYYM